MVPQALKDETEAIRVLCTTLAQAILLIAERLDEPLERLDVGPMFGAGLLRHSERT